MKQIVFIIGVLSGLVVMLALAPTGGAADAISAPPIAVARDASVASDQTEANRVFKLVDLNADGVITPHELMLCGTGKGFRAGEEVMGDESDQLAKSSEKLGVARVVYADNSER